MFGGIFRFFFVYPPVAYQRGRLTLLSAWPRWLLLAAIVAGAAVLGWQLWRRLAAPKGPPDGPRPAARGGLFDRERFAWLTPRAAGVWVLQAAMLALLLVLLWRPALVVSTLVPRQNIAAVLFDDSASMALENRPRLERVKETFAAQTPLMARLADRFQVRLYRFSEVSARIPSADALTARGKTTHLEEALGEVISELKGLPLGAVVLVSDGAGNSATSGADGSGPRAEASVLAELKSKRVPLHAVGVGLERFERDLQVSDVAVASHVPANGMVSASVSVRQDGYAGKTMTLEVRENGLLLHAAPVTFDRPSQSMAVRVNFMPRSPGVKEYTFSFPADTEELIRENNSQSRAVVVDERKLKVLYVEGEPRWEYKFVRRAIADDPVLELVTLLRTSANKFYRQGVESEKTLETGFPKTEELFGFHGLLLGSIEAGFFSHEEMQSVYDFVSRRGGGLLLMGGRHSFTDGGYHNTMVADLAPVVLPGGTAPTFLRREARAELTAHGADSPMLQLAGDPQKSAARWKALPAIGDYQRTGEAKPGAVVLARAAAAGERAAVPLLISQRFGRGRSMLFATGSSWRWQMELESKDDSHELFWRQLLRGLVAETPGPVGIVTDKPLYRDERRIEVRAEVRDRQYQPVEDATLTAVITAPNGSRHEVPLEWSARDEGVYTGRWEAAGTGTFAVEVTARRRGGAAGTAAASGTAAAAPAPGAPSDEIGRATSYFQRTEGTLEFYNAEQNRPRLVRLAEETGGRYYPLEKAADLADDMMYSEGGVTEQNAHELWSLPFVMLLLVALKGAEWSLRKRWGTV